MTPLSLSTCSATNQQLWDENICQYTIIKTLDDINASARLPMIRGAADSCTMIPPHGFPQLGKQDENEKKDFGDFNISTFTPCPGMEESGFRIGSPLGCYNTCTRAPLSMDPENREHVSSVGGTSAREPMVPSMLILLGKQVLERRDSNDLDEDT